MKRKLLALAGILMPFALLAQNDHGASANQPAYKTVIAGPQYEKSESFQKKWGKHYRKEWTTPVRVRVVNLDTLVGGLKPYQAGGGRQSKTLRLRDANKREYVIRSIDKTFGRALPEIYQGTFIEDIINDQVSIAHPYAAVTIAPMANAAKILHTNPTIVFVPKQEALGEFNEEFGDQLYLFEQRPDENWQSARNFSNSKNIVSTATVFEKLQEDQNNRIDQHLFVRSRLFDFFIGDWGRHEDQWRWALTEKDGLDLYRPIPRDRDQVYTLFDGKRLQTALNAAGLDHLQSFDYTVQDITTYGFPARHLDRRMTNEMTLNVWIETAKELQSLMTDALIERSIRQLPPEVFPISGPEIIAKLKSRRQHLQEYALDYYKFLAKEVEVVGTRESEVFIVNRLDDDEIVVEMYKSSADGMPIGEAIYSRRFFASETEEIRLFGMDGKDHFRTAGDRAGSITVKFIGGEDVDVASGTSGIPSATHVYDSENIMDGKGSMKMHVSNNKLVNEYKYDWFAYDDKGFFIKPGMISLSAGFTSKKEGWGKDPYAREHLTYAKYRFTRGSLNIEHQSTFYQALGAWNISLIGGAGLPEVVNFFGVGNETSFDEYDRSYFRLRSEEYYAKLNLNRRSAQQFFAIGGFYSTTKIKNDEAKIVGDYAHGNGTFFDLERKHFAGAEALYSFTQTDNKVVPTKGFAFNLNGSHTFNITNESRSFSRLASNVAVYVPVFKFLTLATRVGGANNFGESEFFQLNKLGGHENLRGFRKWRFYGRQVAYNNNEVRLMFDMKSKLFNGKVGLIGFYDRGRVWMPGEESNKWHAGYGGGIFIAPFNKCVLAINYGMSQEEDRVLLAHVGWFF